MCVLTNERYYNISRLGHTQGMGLGGQKFNFSEHGYHGDVAYQIEADSEQVSKTGYK